MHVVFEVCANLLQKHLIFHPKSVVSAFLHLYVGCSFAIIKGKTLCIIFIFDLFVAIMYKDDKEKTETALGMTKVGFNLFFRHVRTTCYK